MLATIWQKQSIKTQNPSKRTSAAQKRILGDEQGVMGNVVSLQVKLHCKKNWNKIYTSYIFIINVRRNVCVPSCPVPSEKTEKQKQYFLVFKKYFIHIKTDDVITQLVIFLFPFIIANKRRKPAKTTTDCQNKSPCRLTGYDISQSPTIPPSLLVPLPLPVSVPPSLPLSLPARSTTLALTLPLTLAPAAHHRLRPPQEVVHTHVVVVLRGEDKKARVRRRRCSPVNQNAKPHPLSAQSCTLHTQTHADTLSMTLLILQGNIGKK